MNGRLAGRYRWGVPNLAAIAVSFGMAASISTAFNAPIAVLVFGFEVVLRHYATQAFAPVTVASPTGYVIANMSSTGPRCSWSISSAWSTGTNFSSSRSSAYPSPASQWGSCCFSCALIALCIGGGFLGGVFSPALMIGSLIGVLSWMLAARVPGLPISTVAVYAICGMMSFASAPIGAPLTCSFIVYELTQNDDVTIAAKVAVVFSNYVSHRIFGRSLFDVQLARRGVDFSLGRDRARLAAMPVGDLAQDDAMTASAEETQGDVAARRAERGCRQAFVIGPQGAFAGVFTSGRGTGDTTGAAAQVATLTFEGDTSIADAMEQLRGLIGDAAPIIERGPGRYLGGVSEADVVA